MYYKLYYKGPTWDCFS